MGGASVAVVVSTTVGAVAGWLLRGVLAGRRLGDKAAESGKAQLDGPSSISRANGSGSVTWSSPKYVACPHPGWSPPQPQPPPFDPADSVALDPQVVDKASLYSFFISAVTPRPIAFVSTLSASGEPNLAPYSYFNGMGHNPPIVAIGVCRSGSRGGGKKDTLANIEETGEFVVNIISEWFIEAANHTCGEFPRGVDEWQLSGLTPLPSTLVKPARVAEAALHLECRVRQVIEFNDRNGTPTEAVVLGEVVLFHVNRAVTEASPTGKLVVDPTKLRPVSRLGGVVYARSSELYEIPRPAVDGSYPPGFKSKAG